MTPERLPFPKEIDLPADEGIFARSALVACLTDDECRLAGVPDTGQGRAVLDFLACIGYEIDRIDETQINLIGKGHQKPDAPPDAVDCAGSADLAYLFAAFLAGWGLYGAVRCAYPYHSLKGLADSLELLGGEILGRGEACAPPWAIRPAALSLSEIRPANPHPSLRSALGMIFLLGQGTGSFPANTSGYDGLERVIGHYKGDIRRSEGRLFIKGGERVTARRRDMPRSFRLGVVTIAAAALLSVKPVRLRGITLNPSRAATLEIFGRGGVDFTIDNMSDVDGEIAGDLIVNPSEIKGFELSRESVRKSYEDLGPLLTLACLCEGLSEFDLGGLTAPEAAGIMKLAGELSLATGAPLDTGGNRVTIEGNPSGEKDEAAIDAISDYSSRVILALFHRTSSPLDKDRCLLEFGKSLTQIILGDLLF